MGLVKQSCTGALVLMMATTLSLSVLAAPSDIQSVPSQVILGAASGAQAQSGANRAPEASEPPVSPIASPTSPIVAHHREHQSAAQQLPKLPKINIYINKNEIRKLLGKFNRHVTRTTQHDARVCLANFGRGWLLLWCLLRLASRRPLRPLVGVEC